MGIADCSVEENFKHTYEDFKYKADQLIGNAESEKIPRSCFAFQMRPDQKDPDIEEFKPIPDQDLEHLNFYINHIIGMDFVFPLLKKWETTITTPREDLYKEIALRNKKYKETKLRTPLDKDSEDNKLRKRKLLARLGKQIGDCCLLSGSPSDAIIFYKQAIEECKAFNDWEWAGAALEGYISCCLILNRDCFDTQVEAYARYIEAIGFYEKRKADILYIEAQFKLARLHLDHSNRLEMSECLSKIYETSLTLPVEERIKITCSVALLYKESKLMRKFAFYLRETGLLCSSDTPNNDITMSLFLEVAKEYDIEFAEQEESVSLSIKSRREQTFDNGVGWIKIQSSIMKTLYDISVGSSGISL